MERCGANRRARLCAAGAAAVDHVLDTDNLPGDIVLGIPLGIGKPNPFVNALYRRIKANPARRLRIITALSLENRSARAIWNSTSWSRWWSGCLATTPTWTT
jgi:hypothetical protein